MIVKFWLEVVIRFVHIIVYSDNFKDFLEDESSIRSVGFIFLIFFNQAIIGILQYIIE